MSRFSDYIVYVDESGDRNLETINAENPYFIQSFCIFDKKHCSTVVAPQLQKLKFKYFGHDAVLFNAEDFSTQNGAFQTLSGTHQRQQFINDINSIVSDSNFVLIACVIDKQKANGYQQEKEQEQQNIFDQALSFGLDHTYRFLQEREQVDALSHVILNSKNQLEDEAMQLLFRNLCDKNTATKQTLPFELQWAAKNSRPSVLQLSSFITQAVADNALLPEKSDPAFELLKPKFYCKGGRKNVGEGYEGLGLVHFAE